MEPETISGCVVSYDGGLFTLRCRGGAVLSRGYSVEEAIAKIRERIVVGEDSVPHKRTRKRHIARLHRAGFSVGQIALRVGVSKAVRQQDFG